MICRHCGATLPDSSNFCIYCGVPQVGDYTPPPFQPTVYRPLLSIAQLLGDTFTLYTRHFVIMCLVGLFVVGIPAIFEVCKAAVEEAANVAEVADAANIAFYKLYKALFALLGGLATIYVQVAAVQHCLYTARGGADFQPSLMFPSFFMFLKLFGLNIITACILIPFMILALPLVIILFIVAFPIINAAGIPQFGAGLVIGIVAGCIVGAFMIYPAVRLWLAPYFLVDRNMGIIDAVFTAWRVSSGNFWALCAGFFVFFMCILCWMIPCLLVIYFVELDSDSIAGTLILNVGLVPLIAIIWFGGTLAYLQLTGEPNRLDREKNDQETMPPLAF
jgi:hypothetical protein